MPMTAEEQFAAMKRDAVRNLFQGAKLTMNTSRTKEFSKLAREELRGLALDAAEYAREKNLSADSSDALGALSGLMQDAAPEITSPTKLLATVLDSPAAEMLPYVGIFIEFCKGATNLKDAIRHRVQMHLAPETAIAISTGDPQLAFEAMMQVVKREYQREVADGIRCMGTGGLNLGLTIASAGVPWAGLVIGGANCALAIIEQAVLRFRDEKELAAANEFLQGSNLQLPMMFAACPILGCFVIATLDHSTIMTFSADEFGKAGWMDKAQKLIRDKIAPLQTEARKLIARSRFSLTLGSTPAAAPASNSESISDIHTENQTSNAEYNEERRNRANAIDYSNRSDVDAIRQLARRALNAA